MTNKIRGINQISASNQKGLIWKMRSKRLKIAEIADLADMTEFYIQDPRQIARFQAWNGVFCGVSAKSTKSNWANQLLTIEKVSIFPDFSYFSSKNDLEIS